MPPESHTKATERTSTMLNQYLKVALVRSLISEWSTREQIEVLRATLMEVSNPRPQSVSARNDEFRKYLDERARSLDERDQATRCPYD